MAKLLSFMGKFAISGSFCIVYIFAAELFPTEVRCIGIGFCAMMGNLAGLITPFILLLSNFDGLEFVPYLIFGLLAFVAGFLVIFLPETTGKPILRTIEEAVSFYDRKHDSILQDFDDQEHLTAL